MICAINEIYIKTRSYHVEFVTECVLNIPGISRISRELSLEYSEKYSPHQKHKTTECTQRTVKLTLISSLFVYFHLENLENQEYSVKIDNQQLIKVYNIKLENFFN